MVKIFALFFILSISHATLATVVATVDTTEISIDESVHVRYEITGQQQSTPDFSPLNTSFDIVGQNSSSNVSIINGNMSRTTIFNVELMPKKIGTLTIPGIIFDTGTSARIVIEVKKNIDRKNQKDFIFSVVPDKKSLYIQEQLLLTVTLARAVSAQQEQISPPVFSHDDLIIEPLTKDYKRYEAMLNGRRHTMYEITYAVFPQKAGPLVLNPLTYNAVITQHSNRPRSFFDDPFRSTGKNVRQRTQSLSFDVKNKPKEFLGKHWLPASKVTVSSSFNDDIRNVTIGDSITRVITLAAEQQHTSVLPDIAHKQITGVRSYPDTAKNSTQVTNKGMYSQRSQSIAVLMEKSGEIIFPEQRVEWWNTVSNRKEISIIPSQKIQVAPASTGAMSTNSNKHLNETPSENIETSQFWIYIACFALAGWIITIASWLYVHPIRRVRAKNHNHKKTLLNACKNNNIDTAKAALIAFAQHHFPSKNISNLGAVSKVFNDALLSDAINDMQHKLYYYSNTEWDGRTLAHAITASTIKLSHKSNNKHRHILYKIP